MSGIGKSLQGFVLTQGVLHFREAGKRGCTFAKENIPRTGGNIRGEA